MACSLGKSMLIRKGLDENMAYTNRVAFHDV
jgi:hypothetical protein